MRAVAHVSILIIITLCIYVNYIFSIRIDAKSYRILSTLLSFISFSFKIHKNENSVLRKNIFKDKLELQLKKIKCIWLFCINTTISTQLVWQSTNCISDFFPYPPYQQLVLQCTIRKSDFFIMHHHLLTNHNVINYPNASPLSQYIFQFSCSKI